MKCPKCKREFQGPELNQQIGTAIKGGLQVAGNIGWRIAGYTLGGIVGGFSPMVGKAISRCSGQGADNFIGKISDAKFKPDTRCPYCGHKC